MVESEQKTRAQTQMLQEQVKNEQQKRAQTNLQYLLGAGNANKDLAYDPSFQKTINATLAQAGLPPAPTIEEPMPGAPAGAPTRTRIDLQSLLPARSIADLSPTEQEAFWAAPPEVKARIAKSSNLLVDADTLATPAYYPLSSPQRLQAQNQFERFYQAASVGEMTPGQFMTGLSIMRPQLIAAQYDPKAIDDLAKDPSILAAMAPMVQAKLNQLKALGLKTTAEVGAAKSVSDLHEAQSKFFTERTALLPADLQAKWAGINERVRHDQALEADSHTRLQTALQTAQTTATSKAVGDLRGAITASQNSLKEADANYNRLLGIAQGALNSGVGVSQDMVDALAAAKKQRDDLQSTVGQASSQLPALMQASVQHLYGNQRPVTSVKGNGIDTTKPPFDPSKALRKGTITTGANKGQTVLLMPDGHKYLLDGTDLGQ